MTFDAETLRNQIPYYLASDPAQKALIQELGALIGGAAKGYVIPPQFDIHFSTMLQGDGWSGFQLFLFESGKKMKVRGIVLSNSCDVSPENKRVLQARITFAPLVKLSSLKKRFLEAGLAVDQIESRLKAIKSQLTTNVFYLPAEAPLDEEYIALLDDLHSIPSKVQLEEGAKLFALSMAGFYLFVFKLSIHFCRLHEDVDRSAKALIA